MTTILETLMTLLSNTDNDKRLSSVPGLALELRKLVFSYMSPQDLLWDQPTLLLSDSHKPLPWQNWIDVYFPYLETTRNDNYKHNCQALFCEEYRHQEKYNGQHHLSRAELESALSGNLDLSTIDSQKHQIVCAIAVANGHNDTLIDLQVTYKGLALKMAAHNGNLPVVKHLLTTCKNMETHYISTAFRSAVMMNQHPVVQHLLTTCDKDVNPLDKGHALHRASERNYLSIIQLLLINQSDIISDKDKRRALIIAAKNGNEIATRLLLESCAQDIGIYHKGQALKVAAQNGHHPVMKVLLDACGHEIENYVKEAAFRNAIERSKLSVSKQLDVIRCMLTTCSHALGDLTIVNSLHSSVSKNHLPLVELILELCDSQIPLEDKNSLAVQRAITQIEQNRIQTSGSGSLSSMIVAFDHSKKRKYDDTPPQSKRAKPR